MQPLNRLIKDFLRRGSVVFIGDGLRPVSKGVPNIPSVELMRFKHRCSRVAELGRGNRAIRMPLPCKRNLVIHTEIPCFHPSRNKRGSVLRRKPERFMVALEGLQKSLRFCPELV